MSRLPLLLCAVAAVVVAAPHRHFDAFLRSPADRALAVSNDSLAARGANVAHEEKRLGLSTFIWLDGQPASSSAEQAARTTLRRFADVLQLDATTIETLNVRELHQNERSGSVVRFSQRIDGVPVFRSQLDVLVSRAGEPLAISGYAAPSSFVNMADRRFAVSVEQAVAQAFRELTGQSANFRVMRTEEGWVQLALVESSKWQLSSPARARQVFFLLGDRLEPAWHVELDVGAVTSTDAQMVAAVFSARDGRMLLLHDLTNDQSVSYRVWASTNSSFTPESPFGTNASPHPTGVPDGHQPAFVPSNLVTLQNSPFSRNDAWLPNNATTLTGNNADAYADLVAPDGFSPNTTDLRPMRTAPGVFDFNFDVNLSPAANNTQRSAAVTQLFFSVNQLHDVFYDYGFNELAGNAQASNFGRGGREGDFLRVEAQDYTGRNNANMSTPADGAHPRMQVYIFDGQPQLRVTAPAGVIGTYDANTAAFGVQTFNVTGNVLRGTSTTLGCTPFAANAYAGAIALLDRGTCDFATKALNSQEAGAIAVIIANNAVGAAPVLGGANAQVTIPVLSTTLAAGTQFRSTTGTITVQLKRNADLDRDAALDNQIVAHEWGHYLSNRLIGDSTGLVNSQGRSMGEGWSDFVALLQTVREEDRTRPGNENFQGVYPVSTYVTAGGANNGAYYGMRRMPYSTNLAKNSLTLKHIANGTTLPPTAPINGVATGLNNAEVHNSGEVWAQLLWECYAALLNAYSFPEARDRMRSYLVASLKLTPVSPTFLEARDALWATALANDQYDYQRFVAAFAKRGAGVGAVVPDRNVMDHVGVIESYAMNGALQIVDIGLFDDMTSCDRDGILDLNETGTLRVTVKNVGLSMLNPQGMNVTVSGAATFNFPNGPTAYLQSLQPGATTTVNLPIALASANGTEPRSGLTVTFDDPSLFSSVPAATLDVRVNADEVVNASAIDTFETKIDAWQRTGFARNGAAHADDVSSPADFTLTSPWITPHATLPFSFSFKVRHSFEFADSKFWDGAVIEVTDDGVVWKDLFTAFNVNPGYTATLETSGNPLATRPAFAGLSTGFPAYTTRNVNMGTAFAGTPIRLRIRVGVDEAIGAYGIDVDDFTVVNAGTPFSTFIAEPGGVCNRKPLAFASNVTAVEGTLANDVLTRTPVQLNGTSSIDPDGSAITYTWTQLAGPTVTLTGANTATPSFIANVSKDTRFAFQLVVNDGIENSLPAIADVLVTNVNQLPVAAATAPVSVDELTVVTLDGSTSSDADGEALRYRWSQTAGPTVTLSSATVVSPTFTAPDVTTDTVLTFRLLVNDGFADSEAANVSVTVKHVDAAPTVNAGGDITTPGRTLVTLTAVGSDADGDAITYAWSQTSGTSVVLTGATFTAPDIKTAEDLVFLVTATANGKTATDSVTVHVLADQPPMVNAGFDISVPGRMATSLGAFASDPEGDAITYAWSQTSGPMVMLMNANSATPTFISPSVPMVTALGFEVTVTANGLSATDSVVVTVSADRAPTVTAANMTVSARTMATLVAMANDPDGDAITFAWTQTSGTMVALTGADTATPSFTSPDVASGSETLVFNVVVTASGATASTDVTVTVNAANRRPVVSGMNDVTENERVSLTLTAIGMDPDGDALSWSWTQTGGPTVSFTGATTEAITFTTPDVSGDTVLSFSVTVRDADETATAAVKVTVKNVNRAPTAVATAVGTVLNGSGSTDPDGDALTATWTQVDGPTVELTGSNEFVASFIAPKVEAATEFTFELTVSDGSASNAARVTVTVQPESKGGGCGCSSGVEALPLALLALVLRGRRRRQS